MKILMRCIVFVICYAFVLSARPFERYWRDDPFRQKRVEKYIADEGSELAQVRSDRNGRTLVLSNRGLLQPYKERLVPDVLHRPLVDEKIVAFDSYRSRFVYLTETAVLSTAWAGTFLLDTGMKKAADFAVGRDFDVLVVAPGQIRYYHGAGEYLEGSSNVIDVKYDGRKDRFLLLDPENLWVYSEGRKPERVLHGSDFTSMEVLSTGSELLIGTNDGFSRVNGDSFDKISTVQKIPWTEISCICEIGDKLWFGTTRGAFSIDNNGDISYYGGQRWLPDDSVIDIAAGPENSVLILTRTGLSHILFEEMTLARKADFFDELTRRRHIRYGLNSRFSMKRAGDFSTGSLCDQDNDGLWTAMYLAGELFRYATTRCSDVLENCYESFEAMERLYTINPIPGFPSRAFERRGYEVSDLERWQQAGDKHWDWKATTSSDEIVGHFFVLSIFAEVIENPEWKKRSIALMDECMDHIVRNNWYLVDYDGQPTQWGRWHPEYVNQFPVEVGDRRLNSVEIISFLQTAYHFTGKEIYKTKGLELLNDFGYLDNITIPIERIGHVPGIDLSSDWNHSDDELAFLSYWNLYHYAYDDTLREKYKKSIVDHWEIERPEKNPLWAFITASVGAEEFDLEEAIWSLQRMPVDFIDWSVSNSHRKDLEFLPENFRRQTTRDVLPPDERPVSKFNGNAFQLDSQGNGLREYSGDIYLLPYWMGRYLNVIR
jgi:hypothetical protein